MKVFMGMQILSDRVLFVLIPKSIYRFSFSQDFRDTFNHYYNEIDDMSKNFLQVSSMFLTSLDFVFCFSFPFLAPKTNKIHVNPYVFFLSFLLYEGGGDTNQ